jgi:hypothetical protein
MADHSQSIARHHSTPILEFEKYVDAKEGAIVWQDGNKRIFVAHIPNWLANNPETAPRVLAFQSVHGRTYLGTFVTLESAIGVLIH